MQETPLILTVGVLLSLGIGIANLVKPDAASTPVMDSPNNSDILKSDILHVVQLLQQELAIQRQSLEELESSQRMLTQQIDSLSAERETVARHDNADQASTYPASQFHPPVSHDTAPDTSFYSAVVNPELTFEAESSIQQALQEGDIRYSEIETVECRDTTCRVSVNHDANTTSDEFIARLMMTSPFARQFKVETGITADGRQQSIIYLQ